MVRKIVLIEAIAIARQPQASPALRPPTPSAGARPRPPRRPCVRFWPRQAVSAGPRIRSLGPAARVTGVWCDQAPVERVRHMARIRALRTPVPVRLAGRVAALERIIAKPLACARRLARRLRVQPKLALKLACKTPPRTRLYDDPEITLAGVTAFGEARAFLPDTS
jgi:hypothetical protein